MTFSIHTQLLDDCHTLGSFEQCWLLLHHDAAVPWFILVPETDQNDVLALDTQSFDTVMRECKAVRQFVFDHFGCKKINFAAIGNVVPQLHIHVVGRHTDDACWPSPVWGNLNSEQRYSAKQIDSYKISLQETFGLRPV